MKHIKSVLEGVYTNKELRKSIVPLFVGNPGLGKTYLIEEFASDKGVTMVELITSQISPMEVSGIAMPEARTKKMTYYNFDKLDSLKDGDILFFDELRNGNPTVLNACLTMLEQRKFISGKPLPDIMIIAAANPQGATPITPQIKERFVWYTTVFDRDMWKKYMLNKYFMPDSISAKLCNLIRDETFATSNYNTPRSIDKAVNMIARGVHSPYDLNSILDRPIKNSLGDITLSDGTVIHKDEMVSWIKLLQLKYKEDEIIKK
jgi:hypothetical protein